MKLSNYSLLISIVISFSLLKQNGNYAGLFLSHRLRQRGGGEWGTRYCIPRICGLVPRQGSLQASWNPLLNSYNQK